MFEEWERAVTALGPTRQGGSWEATIERVRSYALEFFGPKKIDTVAPSDFAEFWIWRKGNYSQAGRRPNATLRRERTSLLPVFKFAVSKGYIRRGSPAPNPPKAAVGAATRRSRSRSGGSSFGRRGSGSPRASRKAAFRDRLVSQQCFLILANSGMRVGELRQPAVGRPAHGEHRERDAAGRLTCGVRPARARSSFRRARTPT